MFMSRFTRRGFLKTCAASAGALAVPGCANNVAVSAAGKKPNIIFIMTDDQADWAFGAAPNPDARTPNIDKLCGHGARLANCFVTTPVCSPSRATLMTSRHGTEVGITDFIKKPDVGLAAALPTWPRILAEAGYVTALIGKWHLGATDDFHPTRYGYTEFTGFRWGGRISKDPKVEVQGKQHQISGYTPDILTDYAIDFVRRRKDVPFMLSLHYWAPHISTVHRAADGQRTWLPLSDVDWKHFKDSDPSLPDPDYPDLDVPCVKRMMREYLASTASADRNIGRLLSALDQMRLSDNTIVIFTSDNGYNIGHNGIRGKGNGDWVLTDNRRDRPNLYDNSLRVPAIIRWPGRIKAGLTIDRTVSFLDWFPTLLAMAGLDVPKNTTIRGRNFLPLLLGQSIKWDNDLFVQYSMRGAGDMRSYRTTNWKLVRDFKHVIEDELYNLAKDPAETTNVIDSPDPNIQKVRRRLNGKLLQEMRRIKDPALPEALREVSA
jgi:uncharacterized sulfatase